MKKSRFGDPVEKRKIIVNKIIKRVKNVKNVQFKEYNNMGMTIDHLLGENK